MILFYLLITEACTRGILTPDIDVFTLTKIGLSMSRDDTKTYLTESKETVTVNVEFMQTIDDELIAQKCRNTATLSNRTIIASFTSSIFNRYPDLVVFHSIKYFNPEVKQKKCDGEPIEEYKNFDFESCTHMCETLDSCKAFTMNDEKVCSLFESCEKKLYDRSSSYWIKQKGAGII